jgi:MOSC domain-containing protein YiiM
MSATEKNGSITSLNLSPGGVPKLRVPSVEITTAGLVGDRQRNLKYHGGPDRAVCLLAQEIIDELAAQGHPIRPGSTGENLTIAGLFWERLASGQHLTIGDRVVLELTTPAAPCRTIASSFRDGDFACLDHRRTPGCTRWYARVVTAGTVSVGDDVALVNQS